MKDDEQPTILIAEDDEGHARLIELGLAEEGLSNPVKRFRDGAETWAFLSGKSDPCLQPDRPYLLLLDLRMPGMDGLEVLRRLKSAPPLKNLRIIITSTTDDPAEQGRCRGLGCADFMLKPIDTAKLAKMIKFELK